MLSMFDVDYRIDCAEEAARRYVERRRMEIWEEFFSGIEGIPDGVSPEAINDLYRWVLGQFFESRNILDSLNHERTRGSVTQAEIEWARLVNPRAYSLGQRIAELFPDADPRVPSGRGHTA